MPEINMYPLDEVKNSYPLYIRADFDLFLEIPLIPHKFLDTL